jgi:hypothetical protein
MWRLAGVAGGCAAQVTLTVKASIAFGSPVKATAKLK